MTIQEFDDATAAVEAIESEAGPENETKAERFSRLATARLRKLLKQMDLLENCSSSNYEYTPEQVAKMFAAIDKRYKQLQDAYLPKAEEDAIAL